jgi:hypothetical protein
MGLVHSPRIVTDGLVLCLDAANPKSYPGKTGPNLVTEISVLSKNDGLVFNVFRTSVLSNNLVLCNVTAGKSYIVEYGVSAYRGSTGATFRVANSGSNITPGIAIFSVGTFVRTFTANISDILSINGDNTGTDFDLNFVSVREMIENTGSIWKDVSGNNGNGILSSVTYDASNNGSLVFDNSGDNIIIDHSDKFNFSSSFTVYSWILVNSFNTSSIYNVVSKKPSFNNTQKGWSCQYDYRTNGVLQYRNNNGTLLNDHTPTSTTNNTSLLNQTVNFVNSVWVINNNFVSFYINGLLKSTISVNFIDTDTTTNINIGKTVNSVGDPSLPMNLSNVAIYNRALSEQEIVQNFNALRGRYGI